MADPVAILEFPEAVATVTFPAPDPAVAQVELPTFEVVATLEMPDLVVVPGLPGPPGPNTAAEWKSNEW